MKKIMLKFISGVAALALALLSVQGTSASVSASPLQAASAYYVSPTGNDANTGAINAPFKTIQNAASKTAAGDTIILLVGSYTGAATVTEDNEIWNTIQFPPELAASVLVVVMQPGQSIQQAVNDAKAGDTIIVPAGTYDESVRISKDNLTVKCEQPLQCTVKRFEVWGSGNTLEGFVITGGKSFGVEVRQHNNTIRNVDISGILYDFTLPKGQGDANGITFFGTGHTFDRIHIHDIDQYHVDDLGYPEPHQDCFQTWDVLARGGAASFITITNTICDMPAAGNGFISKMLQSSGGSHDWTVRNVVSIAPMACLFYDEAYNIDISYSTFIGAGIEKPQGCKFLKLNNSPAPHDNDVTYSIFQNITGTDPIYDYVDSHHNCFWQTAKRNPEPGDVWGDPLFVDLSNDDFHLQSNSPCTGMGAYLSSPSTAMPPPTPTPIGTSTSIPVTITSSPPPTIIVSSPTRLPTNIPQATATSVPPTEAPTESPAPSGTVYDQTDVGFIYSPEWTDIGNKKAYGKSYKETSSNGATVIFPFTGQFFSILYTGGPAFRSMDVYVDDILVGTINQKVDARTHQLRWDYTGQLESGMHTLKLVFVTSNTQSNTKGSLDAVIVR